MAVLHCVAILLMAAPVTVKSLSILPQPYELPTTELPTTEPSTSELPTTEIPTTELPTTEPPTTERTLPEHTTIPGPCGRTNRGDELFPGQTKTYTDKYSCEICTCGPSGPECIFGDCIVPMCVDAARKTANACCRTCPNGQNCQIPGTKQIINGTEPVVVNGMSCRCPSQSGSILLGSPQPEAYYTTAMCTPILITTSPPQSPGCRLSDGQFLAVNNSRTKGCETCYCDGNSKLACATRVCAAPNCPNHYVPKGGCCPVCPEGCRLSDGQFLAVNMSRTKGCETCYCNGNSKLACTAIACAAPNCPNYYVPKGGCCPVCPEGCRLPDGVFLPINQTRTKGCETCHCGINSIVACYIRDCARPTCANYYVPEGGCCPVCRKGEYCKLASGQIIPAGRTIKMDGKLCSCRIKPNTFSLVAHCRSTISRQEKKKIAALLRALIMHRTSGGNPSVHLAMEAIHNQMKVMKKLLLTFQKHKIDRKNSMAGLAFEIMHRRMKVMQKQLFDLRTDNTIINNRMAQLAIEAMQDKMKVLQKQMLQIEKGIRKRVVQKYKIITIRKTWIPWSGRHRRLYERRRYWDLGHRHQTTDADIGV